MNIRNLNSRSQVDQRFRQESLASKGHKNENHSKVNSQECHYLCSLELYCVLVLYCVFLYKANLRQNMNMSFIVYRISQTLE